MDTLDAVDTAIGAMFGSFAPLIKLAIALLIGILIGWEREYRENIAGMRIMPLVAVGATLFAGFGGIEGKQFINAQVAAGVVTGVGFLGAGVIKRESGVLSGVTTAACIWVTAALGMGISLGAYVAMGLVTGAVLLILWVFPHFTARSNHSLYYEIIAPYDEERYEQFQRRFTENKLEILRHSWSRNGDQMMCLWYVNGLPESHERLGRLFISDLEITQFNTKLS
ncbi:MAG: MgtC/SapB family protein [Anaerolineae bacterium]|nr:MgtC/SapB family protein [Anaerolineae bacterium]